MALLWNAVGTEQPTYLLQLYALTVLCVKPTNKQYINALRVIIHLKAVYHVLLSLMQNAALNKLKRWTNPARDIIIYVRMTMNITRILR
jgi:hypothetical protein